MNAMKYREANKTLGRNLCPCGSAAPYDDCCRRYLDSIGHAPTAEALMRSRYTAYALRREAHLLKTWHPSTRPARLGLEEESGTRWIGLEVKRHEMQDATHAIVEFVARFKINGRAHRLHEVSRFLFSDDQWFYVDGST